MPRLNPQQQEAVTQHQLPMLVLAGAGSGKTSVITQKVLHLLRLGTQPNRILGLTFTNKAAKEMRERLAKQSGELSTRGLRLSTFHTFGLSFIRREAGLLGLQKNLSLFDEHDRLTLMKSVLDDHPQLAPEHAEGILKQIGHWKNDGLMPDALIGKCTTPEERLAQECYQLYQGSLQACNAVDFDDLILLPVHLLSKFPERRQHWQNRISHLLVDEYQDTNSCQYQLIRQLIAPDTGFTVVGDDDQAIYTWRGAKPENMALLQKDFPKLKVIKLEQNYRSTRQILDAANQLIKHNQHLFEKSLWSALGDGDAIKLIVCKNEEDEARRIASDIFIRHLQDNKNYGQFAILYRSNHQAKLFELKLREHQIPYSITGGDSLFNRTEIKDLLSYLRLILNPDDDAAFARIINTPRRKVGPATLKRIGEVATTYQTSRFSALFHPALDPLLPPSTYRTLQVFSRWVQKKQQQLSATQDVKSTLLTLLAELKYREWLLECLESVKAVEARWQLIELFIDQIAQLAEDKGIEDALSTLMLRDVLDRQEEDDAQEDRVQLMTLHASKGLEFPFVYLTGLEEEILPHKNSLDGHHIEEERRLTYVGITRAQRALTITRCKMRKQQGEWVHVTPSRFLDELPMDEIKVSGLGVKETAKPDQGGFDLLRQLVR